MQMIPHNAVGGPFYPHTFFIYIMQFTSPLMRSFHLFPPSSVSPSLLLNRSWQAPPLPSQTLIRLTQAPPPDASMPCYNKLCGSSLYESPSSSHDSLTLAFLLHSLFSSFAFLPFLVLSHSLISLFFLSLVSLVYIL